MNRMRAGIHEILREAQTSGTLQGWEGFIREAHPIVAAAVFRALSCWRAPGKDQIEDMVQETFLKLCDSDFHLLRRIRSEQPEAVAAYLRVVAANVVADAFRTRSAQKRGAGRETVDLEQVNVEASGTGSVRDMEHQILLQNVNRCLTSQSPRDRQIFWLYYRHGLTVDAIAAIQCVQLTANGVDSLLRRLTAAVRKCLKISTGRQVSMEAKGNPL